MTREAIAARGPRMRLIRVYRQDAPIGHVIFRDDHTPFRSCENLFATLARSYSLRYLLQIGAVMRLSPLG